MGDIDRILEQWDDVGPADVRDEIIEHLSGCVEQLQEQVSAGRRAYRRLAGLVWVFVAIVAGLGVAVSVVGNG